MRILSSFRVIHRIAKERISFLERLVGQERLVVAELTRELDVGEVALRNAEEKMVQMGQGLRMGRRVPWWQPLSRLKT